MAQIIRRNSRNH